MEHTPKHFTDMSSCLPDAVRYIASLSGYRVFSEIYSHGCKLYNTTLVKNYIPMSRRTLQKATGLGRIKIENAIDELNGLNLLSSSCKERENNSYKINWEEIHFISELFHKISYEDIRTIYAECNNPPNFIPASQLKQSKISEVVANYKFNFERQNHRLNETPEINPDLTSFKDSQKVANVKSGLILNETPEINPDLTSFKDSQKVANVKSGLILNETPEINPDCNNANFGRKHKFSEDEDENVVLDVYLDSMESMLVKYAGLSRININCSVKSGLVSIPIWIDFQGFSSKSKLTCRPKAKRTTIKNKMVEEATGRELGIDGPIKALTSELSQNLSQNSGISGSCPFQQEDKEKQKKKNSPCTPIKEKENKEKEENPQTPSNLLERVERLEKVKEVEKEEKVKECRKVEDIKEAVNERSEFTAEEEKKILKVIEKNERSEFFSTRGGDEVFAEKTEAARAPMNSQFAHGGKRAAECMDGGLEETVEEPEEEKLQLDDEEDGLSQPASPLTPDERYRRDLEEVMKKYDNPYRNKPYFKEAEIRRMVESLEYCASSPVKLFVNNFWWSLYEWCGEDDEYNLPADENGEPIESDDPGLFDMVGRFIRVDDAMKVLRHAWEEVADQVECGFVELEDGRVDITAGEVPDVSLGRLVDWRTTTDPNGHEVFVISLRGFRDIEAEDAHEAKTPSTKEEVKAFHRTNRRFFAAVVNMDDSQLTPIERAVKDFAATFMKLDKYYFVERFMNGRGLPMACSELPGYILKPWTLRLDGLGVETEDFYRILNYRGRPYMDGSDLQKMPSTFSYQEVMRWNDMNGFQSSITEETLRNALSTDF